MAVKEEKRLELGQRVRALRNVAGWDAKELARRSGLTASTLSKIENGTQPPSPAQIWDITNALAEAPALAALRAGDIRAVLWGDKQLTLGTTDAVEKPSDLREPFGIFFTPENGKSPAEAGPSETRTSSRDDDSDQMS